MTPVPPRPLPPQAFCGGKKSAALSERLGSGGSVASAVSMPSSRHHSQTGSGSAHWADQSANQMSA